MHVGVVVPQYDFSVPGESPLRWETVAAAADAAVRAGFTSLWVSDHLFLSIEKYGGPAGEHGCFDPVVTMAALGQRHRDVTIGCLVFCAQLRAPRVLAKQVQTLHNLAPGRVVAGLGAGWYEPEFAAAGVAFERPAVRLRQLAETIEEVRAFLAEHDGAGSGPVPLWVGGRGDRLLGVAARHADGWNMVWAVTQAAYRERLAVLHAACEAAGRDPETVTLSLGLHTLVGEDERDLAARYQRLQQAVPPGVLDSVPLDEWRQGRLVGTVDQVREQVSAWGDLGVAVLVVNPGALPFSVTDTDDLDLVASAIR